MRNKSTDKKCLTFCCLRVLRQPVNAEKLRGIVEAQRGVRRAQSSVGARLFARSHDDGKCAVGPRR